MSGPSSGTGHAQIQFSEAGAKSTNHWLIIEPDETDLCYVDPGLEETVWIETSLRSMVETWMGWKPLKQALDAGDIVIDGHRSLTDDPFRWIGQSPLAGVAKRPIEERVGT